MPKVQMEGPAASSVQKCWWPVPDLSKTAAVLIFVTVLFSWTAASAGEASDKEESIYSQHSGYSVTIVACVAAAAFLILMVYILASCTDCYKSEVSTDFHPATGQSGGVRWGGAGGYNAAASSDVNDVVLGAGFTGEAVLPGQGNNPGLPYAMIPAQVPEAHGFRGYGSAPPAPDLMGYGGGGDHGGAGYGVGQGAGGRPQHLPGAHVSVVNQPEPEDPPPPYASAPYR